MTRPAMQTGTMATPYSARHACAAGHSDPAVASSRRPMATGTMKPVLLAIALTTAIEVGMSAAGWME
eukprot:2878770-Prymnesium_polylepis.1